MTVAKELSKHEFNLEEVQEVTVHNRMISAVRKFASVSDRML
jgi:hypothetical protein